MKRLALIVTLSAGLVSCSDDDGPIRLVNVRAVNADCSLAALVLPSGNLDVSASNPRYLLAVDFQSILEETSTTVGGIDISGPGSGSATFRAVELSYTSEPPGGTASERLAIFASVPAGTQAGSVIVEALGPAGATFAEQRADTPGSTATLFVNVRLRGETGSGDEFTTNEVTFPIRLANSGFGIGQTGCPQNTELAPQPAGACSVPGQDANVICRPTTPAAPAP